MIANNRYKVLLWNHETGTAKIETFYADGTNQTELHTSPHTLDEVARTLFEKDAWEFIQAKYDGPSTDVTRF